MATQPTNPPSVNEFPPAPNSITDSVTEFDAKANNFVAAQVSYVPQANTLSDWYNDTAQITYDNAIETEESAESAAQQVVLAQQKVNEAESFSVMAEASANMKGEWSSLSGAISKPASVYHKGSYWALLYDLADVSVSEPGDSANWAYLNLSNKFTTIQDGDELSIYLINKITTTQANKLPLASSVVEGGVIKIAVENSDGGIVTTHLVSGTDTTTDRNGVSDGFIFNWPTGGEISLVSNGVDNWSY